MFTIYQIHERGGEYEDRFDYVVGSYLHKEKAERELKRLVDEENDRMAYFMDNMIHNEYEPICYELQEVEVEE